MPNPRREFGGLLVVRGCLLAGGMGLTPLLWIACLLAVRNQRILTA